MSLSPWSVWTSTLVWLSATVVKIRLLRVGMVLLRSMRGVKVPSRVSMPSVCGVTSRSTSSLTSPAMIPVWMAAPIAIPSSGFTARLGSLPNTRRTISATFGARVCPPTSRTSSICSGFRPASARHRLQGSIVRSRRSSVSPSYFCRVSTVLRCLGPDESAEMKGSTISVCWEVDSSHLAFSAASLRRWSAWRRSMLVSRENSAISQSMMRWSKSSPPRKVSPPVARTWKRPSAISRIEMSKVPPPRS